MDVESAMFRLWLWLALPCLLLLVDSFSLLLVLVLIFDLCMNIGSVLKVDFRPFRILMHIEIVNRMNNVSLN